VLLSSLSQNIVHVMGSWFIYGTTCSFIKWLVNVTINNKTHRYVDFCYFIAPLNRFTSGMTIVFYNSLSLSSWLTFYCIFFPSFFRILLVSSQNVAHVMVSCFIQELWYNRLLFW
jgi:hypothetical protein